MFFLGKSNSRPRPQPQCTAPNTGPRFIPGSESNPPLGNSDHDPCQQDAPPRNKWNPDEEFYRYDENQDKKTIHSECQPQVLRSKINEDNGLKNAAKKVCRNQQVKNDITAMENQIPQGNMNPGIDSKTVGEDLNPSFEYLFCHNSLVGLIKYYNDIGFIV